MPHDGVVRAVLLAMECPKDDLAGNLRRHLAEIAYAESVQADLVVCPEFSLTGGVDPAAEPTRAITLEHEAVRTLVAATASVAVVFGLAESGGPFIAQVVAAGLEVVAIQRKRYLGEGEEGYAIGTTTATVDVAGRRCGIVICAEAGQPWTWDACAEAGADVILCCSAPGLSGRRTDEAGWRAGLSWWESCGLADARHHARGLGLPVLMSTQAGSTADEDFPGLAAAIDANGHVLDRTVDWRPGRLVVDL